MDISDWGTGGSAYRWQTGLSHDLRGLHTKGVFSEALLLPTTGVGRGGVRWELLLEFISRGVEGALIIILGWMGRRGA